MTEMKSAEVKLSQMEALMLESLRALGWSDEELIQKVKSKELPIDESEFEFDYQELAAFAELQLETFETAVRQGYSMKYNTINGIRCWIVIALGKEPVVNRKQGHEAVKIALTLEEKERLNSVLSFGWAIAGEHEGSPKDASLYEVNPKKA